MNFAREIHCDSSLGSSDEGHRNGPRGSDPIWRIRSLKTYIGAIDCTYKRK